MNRNPWLWELRVSLPVFLGFLFIGWMVENLAMGTFCFLLVYTFRHLYHLYKLEKWLREGGLDRSQPEGSGIWEAIYDHYYAIRRKGKNYKKQLSKNLKRYRKATAALPDATVVLGASYEIDWFNAAAAPILGLQKRDRGNRIANLIRHPDFVSYLQKDKYDSTVDIPAPGNSKLIIQIRIVPYGGGLRLLIAQDITRLRQMERMRSDFVSNVSHELRTPLTVLRGYLETFLDMDDVPFERMKKSLAQMDQQAKRMQFLVDDLLLLARLETSSAETPREVVDIHALVGRICSDAKLIRGDQTEIKQELESDLMLWGAEQELFSAFSNLVVNAIKHTPADTPVTVRWYATEEYACLDVLDQGIGIDAKHIPRLTERFYRVDPDRSRTEGGTGLGLAIVKHVLSRHDAQLVISSEIGKGSCFSCRFDIAKTVTARPEKVINLS